MKEEIETNPQEALPASTGSENEVALVAVRCGCGWDLAIMLRNLDEIAAGVWGTIKCGRCNARMNARIKTVAEARSQNNN